MQHYVIIVAGGKGLRMRSEVPKQFLLLNGKPVLMHTIEAFFYAIKNIRIILVLPEEHQVYWKKLCREYNFEINHQVVTGGETRFHSVKNGLKMITDNALIAIHDGVRPLVSYEIITQIFRIARDKGCAYPVIPVTDTLRKKNEQGTVTVNRNDYFLVQTPQVFRSEIILEAYALDYSEKFTDDISVVEKLGKYLVFEVPGEKENIKITNPFDLIIAEALIDKRNVHNETDNEII